MSMQSPVGTLDIKNATLRVGKLEVSNVQGIDTALNVTRANSVLVYDDQVSTTTFSGFTSTTGVRDTGNGYLNIAGGHVYWGQKLPNSWVMDFEMDIRSGTSAGPLYANVFSTTNTGGDGYSFTFNDNNDKITLKYDGTTLAEATVSGLFTASENWQKVVINYERGLIAISVDGSRKFYYKDIERSTPYVNGEYINFSSASTDGRKIRDLRIVNGEKWVYSGESNVAFTQGSVGVGVSDPAYTLDVGGDINLSGSFYQGGSPFVSSLWTDGANSLYYRSNVEVGTGNLFVDTTTSNVGIRTTTPAYELDVAGNVNAHYFLGDGSQLTGIATDLESVSNIGNTTSNTIQFTNATTGFVTESNVGIANTNPQNDLDVGSNLSVLDTGSNVLSVTGNVSATSITIGDFQIVSAYGLDHVTNENNQTTDTIISTNATTGFQATSNIVAGGTVQANKIVSTSNLEVGTANLFVDTTTSNVGIGTNAPDYELDVVGNVNATYLIGDGSAISAIQSSNVTNFASNVSRITALESSRALKMDLDNNSSRITNLSSNLSDNSSRITALESGDTSISGDKTFTGDIIFESNVHMNGNVLVANTVNLTVSDPIIELGSNNSGTNDLGIIMTRPNNNSNVAVVFDESVDILRMGYTLNGASDSIIDLDSNALAVSVQGGLTVGSNLEVGAANLFVDTTTSRVGINVASPSYTLDVGGDINLSTGSTLKINGTPAVFSNWTVSGSDIYRSSGNVGIGTTSPQTTLNVRGSVSTGRNLAREVGSVIAYSSQHVTSRGATNVINGKKNFENGNDDWITASGQRVNAYVVIDLTAAYSVDRLVIYNQNEYSDSKREVKGFKLQGSADNSTWADIIVSECGRSNAHEPNPGWSFRIPQNWDDDDEGTSYRYWKFIMTSFHGTDGYGGIMELELYEASDALDDEVSTSSLVAQDVYSETGNFSRGLAVGKGYSGTSTGANNLLVEGNVGIGTASPGEKLHVHENLSTSGHQIAARIGGTASSTYSTLVFGSKEGRPHIGGHKGDYGAWHDLSLQNDLMVLKQSNMRVGIGTTGPDADLHIYGSTSQSNIFLGEDGSIDKAAVIKYRQGDGNGTGTLHIGHWGDSFSATAATNSLCIKKGGNVGVGTSIPVAKLDVIGSINNGTYGVSSGYMANRSLTIGSHGSNYGGGTSGWNTNTAGFLMECLDTTEIAVHDSGTRVASFMYFQGGSTNKFTIGRSMGWGKTNVEVAGVLKNNNPAFYAQRTSNISGNNVIIWNSQKQDRTNNYNTSNGRFTAPIAGYYFFSFWGLSNGSVTTHYDFKKNGSVVHNAQPYSRDLGNMANCSGTIVVELAVNDYISVWIRSGTMYGGGNDHNGFCGYLIG